MSQHDPQRGRTPGGPPDLDQVIQNWMRKLSAFFGGKPPESQGGSGMLFGGASAVLAIVATLWLGSGFYVVDEREDAVIMRFGSYVETVTNSGLHWHLPWPLESRQIVNMTEVRSLPVGGHSDRPTQSESAMLTADQNIIEVQLEVQYTIRSAKDFVFNNRFTERDAGADVVRHTAQTAIREVVGRNPVDFVLNEGRGSIAGQAQELIQQLLDKYATGIQVSRVNISDVQPPEPVQAAFSDAVKARQDKARLINEGQAYANDVVPKARGMAARLLEEAQGYQQRVVATAEGDASRFRSVVSEYSKAPGVTRDRIYYDTMQQVLSTSSKVLVDQKGSGNLLYLPLDKLIESVKPAAEMPVQMTPGKVAESGEAGANTAVGRVDASRGRGEREGR